MASLPANTPRPLIWVLNLLVMLGGYGLWRIADEVGPVFCAGWVGGYVFLAVTLRLSNGYWPSFD